MIRKLIGLVDSTVYRHGPTQMTYEMLGDLARASGMTWFITHRALYHPSRMQYSIAVCGNVPETIGWDGDGAPVDEWPLKSYPIDTLLEGA